MYIYVCICTSFETMALWTIVRDFGPLKYVKQWSCGLFLGDFGPVFLHTSEGPRVLMGWLDLLSDWALIPIILASSPEKVCCCRAPESCPVL